MSKVKNGETSVSEEPKHVFANPYVPAVCPFISLGLWLLLYDGEYNSTSKVFTGSNQKSKFAGQLNGIIDTPQGREELSKAGMTIRDFGCHGLRKGSSTFVCMSSNLCNIVAVSLRASWFMGIHKTYLKHDGAGDSNVGRAVAGLPVNSYRFCVLPPRFLNVPEEQKPKIEEALRDCFPAFYKHGECDGILKGVLKLLLASLVYANVLDFRSRRSHRFG